MREVAALYQTLLIPSLFLLQGLTRFKAEVSTSLSRKMRDNGIVCRGHLSCALNFGSGWARTNMAFWISRIVLGLKKNIAATPQCPSSDRIMSILRMWPFGLTTGLDCLRTQIDPTNPVLHLPNRLAPFCPICLLCLETISEIPTLSAVDLTKILTMTFPALSFAATLLLVLVYVVATTDAFFPLPIARRSQLSVSLFASQVKAAPLVSGAELEMLLTDMEQPLVVDAYATWW
jgi:hypothetical protein